MNKTIGSCSLCGGPVTVPQIWHGVNDPVPTCQKCGATAAKPSGPVIPMQPARPRRVRRYHGEYDMDWRAWGGGDLTP